MGSKFFTMTEAQLKKATAFRNFLYRSGISYPQAAAELSITESHVARLAQGNCLPSLKLAVKIDEWSEGHVACSDWIREETARKKRLVRKTKKR